MLSCTSAIIFLMRGCFFVFTVLLFLMRLTLSVFSVCLCVSRSSIRYLFNCGGNKNDETPPHFHILFPFISYIPYHIVICDIPCRRSTLVPLIFFPILLFPKGFVDAQMNQPFFLFHQKAEPTALAFRLGRDCRKRPWGPRVTIEGE